MESAEEGEGTQPLGSPRTDPVVCGTGGAGAWSAWQTQLTGVAETLNLAYFNNKTKVLGLQEL